MKPDQGPVHFPPPSMRPYELGLWVLFLLTGVALNVARHHEPLMADDSYQYLSVAENIRYQHHISTSLVHFDIERSRGRIPAPCTTFPAGYPILISLISAAGFSLPTAGLIISLLSGLAIVPLLGFAANFLSIPPGPIRICLLLWVTNSFVIAFSSGVFTESLFTLLTFAAIVLVLRYESLMVQNNRGWLLLLAFLCAGVAYWVRYAGAFLFAALVVYGLVQAYKNKNSRAAWLSSMAFAAGIIGIGALRNALITGTWKGEYTTNPHHSLLLIARTFVSSISRVFFGDLPLHFDVVHRVAEVTACLGASGLFLALATALVRKESRTEIAHRLVKPLPVLILYSMIYAAGMCYLGAVTEISFGPRMFFPLLPVVLLVIALVGASLATHQMAVTRLWSRMACAVFLVGYAVVNVQRVATPYVDPHQRVAPWLQMPMKTGQPLAAWIKENIANNSVIVSEEGQATGFLLHRNTISLVPPQFSVVLWGEPQLREVMQSFNAEYLLVYTVSESEERDMHDDAPFLKQLANGRPPSWLTVAAENSRVKVFRRSL